MGTHSSKEYMKQWRENNREKCREYARKGGKKLRAKTVNWYKDYKSGLTCELCNEKDPVCLEFHHIDPSTKIADISVMVRNRASVEKILAEMEKCEVICANCHRKTHHPEGYFSRVTKWDDHTHVKKGWGYEQWIVNKPEYCGKLLFVQKDKKFSLHFHKLKDETFFLQEGLIQLTYYKDSAIDNLVEDWDNLHNVDEAIEVVVLEPGDSFHIPIGLRHTVRGLLASTIFEFSTQHFDEDSFRVIKGD